MEASKQADCTWIELYCLEGLDSLERRYYEHHLRTCPCCQQTIDEWQAIADFLLYDIPTNITPSITMKQRAMNRIFPSA